ncbi:glycosyltransferase [Winogradskyella sp. 3972H.M.0a.05]|uniref:glycosyltransferase family 4 protein n=1 Tax=Winogradskyella sp. 3972H.M.0a.05 TaxID=2950277 RepID=UPI003391EEB8
MKYKIAILSPNEANKAETFIKNHIASLPYESVVIYGGNFPHLESSNLPTKLQKKWFGFRNVLRGFLGIPKKDFRAYWLKRILIKEKPDLVFAEYLITAAETIEVCKSLKIPLVATALGYDISQYNILEIYDAKYRALMQYVSKVFVVSKHMRNAVEDFGCESSKIVYSPIGPRTDFFEISPSYKHKDLLAIGRFVDKKAPHLTIEAFSIVAKKNTEAKLIMAGDGPLLETCQKLADDLDIANRVEFKGRIDQETQKQLLGDSSIFVQHSVIAKSGDSEGTPVAILEASAAGLPIVSTNHAGIPSVVVNNETGFLVEEGDVHKMAEKILELLGDEDTIKQFGNAGKQYVKDNFSLDKHIDILSSHILEVLNPK